MFRSGNEQEFKIIFTGGGFMRILLSHDPFVDPEQKFWDRGKWPAQWVAHPDVIGDKFSVTAYRRRFDLQDDSRIVIHVTADERYELFLDGNRIGRGSERGDRENWFFETYELKLEKGAHVLVAKTWWLGPDSPAPYAQLSVRPAFLLAADKYPEWLSTGVAKWQAKRLGGFETLPAPHASSTGAKVKIRGSEFDWGFEWGGGEGWVDVIPVGEAASGSVVNEFKPIWMLTPAVLPPMLEAHWNIGKVRHIESVTDSETSGIKIDATRNIEPEARKWNEMLSGLSAVTIPPRTIRRVIVDLGNYYCAHPELTVSGGKGSKVRVLWAEALFETQDFKAPKGNRSEIDGKHFMGLGDIFEPDGGKSRTFETLWWEAGRFLEFFVSTGDKDLTINSFKIRETHYPYIFDSSFTCNDDRLDRVIPTALRTLEMCSHETYMDCPYYEQLQYVGDTRIQALVTYLSTKDARLPKKALMMFDKSRLHSGLTQSRYPNRVLQVISPFSLWWVAMIFDYALWRGEPEFVAELIPGSRAVMNHFCRKVNKGGLLAGLERWCYMDWVNGWRNGTPPGGDLGGVSGPVNWQFVWVLRQAALVEQWAGDPEIAQMYERYAESGAKACNEAFWQKKRGMFSDDLEGKFFSEHSQCLSLLGGLVDEDKRESVVRGLLAGKDMARTSIYFKHYLFETLRLIGRIDRLFEELSLWFDLESCGFCTTLEEPEPSRSDCHAWGAHPVYHYFASILGIRPAAFGFGKVQVEPMMGPLEWAKGVLPHPNGDIAAEFKKAGDRISGKVVLPDGVTGEFRHGDNVVNLKPGENSIREA